MAPLAAYFHELVWWQLVKSVSSGAGFHPGFPDTNFGIGVPLKFPVVSAELPNYILRVIRLTKQEQLVLTVVLLLLLTGWAVQAYRTAHPPTPPSKILNAK